jgi:hypothetical protein
VAASFYHTHAYIYIRKTNINAGLKLEWKYDYMKIKVEGLRRDEDKPYANIIVATGYFAW